MNRLIPFRRASLVRAQQAEANLILAGSELEWNSVSLQEASAWHGCG
jgi:hypothetical protein